jgi:hypothetical protein
MTTTVANNPKLDQRIRPYGNDSIDALFQELVLDANWVNGLLTFAQGLYAEHNTDKIDASSVFAFVQSVSMPMRNVVDALAPIIYELHQREEEWNRAQANVLEFTEKN